MEETRMKMRKKAILVSALLASLVSSGVMADQAADIEGAKDNAAKALGQVTALDGKVKNIEKDLTTYKDKTDTSTLGPTLVTSKSSVRSTMKANRPLVMYYCTFIITYQNQGYNS